MLRHIIGIGEYVVTRDPSVTIVTHALGSCIAVCVWDAKASVAGMLHFLLPDAKLNPERARIQPGAFADTGIPLLFQAAYERGAQKGRCRVSLIGGATVTSGSIDIGRRNILAARRVLWQNGMMVSGEVVGGTDVRTVSLSNQYGRVEIRNGRDVIQELCA